MEIHIKTLTGQTADIYLDDKATINELRSKICRELFKPSPDALEQSINNIGYINLIDITGSRITIFRDDPNDINLISFLKSQKSEFKFEKITAFFVLNLGREYYRPTKHNPRGVPLYVLDENEKQNTFFKSITEPDPKQNFTVRLEKINFDGEIPDNFLDPITLTLMNSPILASDTHNYDYETIKKLNHISPYTKTKFKRIEHNLLLKSQIEDFVSEQEQRVLNCSFKK